MLIDLVLLHQSEVALEGREGDFNHTFFELWTGLLVLGKEPIDVMALPISNLGVHILGVTQDRVGVRVGSYLQMARFFSLTIGEGELFLVHSAISVLQRNDSSFMVLSVLPSPPPGTDAVSLATQKVMLHLAEP